MRAVLALTTFAALGAIAAAPWLRQYGAAEARALLLTAFGIFLFLGLIGIDFAQSRLRRRDLTLVHYLRPYRYRSRLAVRYLFVALALYRLVHTVLIAIPSAESVGLVAGNSSMQELALLGGMNAGFALAIAYAVGGQRSIVLCEEGVIRGGVFHDWEEVGGYSLGSQRPDQLPFACGGGAAYLPEAEREEVLAFIEQRLSASRRGSAKG